MNFPREGRRRSRTWGASGTLPKPGLRGSTCRAGALGLGELGITPRSRGPWIRLGRGDECSVPGAFLRLGRKMRSLSPCTPMDLFWGGRLIPGLSARFSTARALIGALVCLLTSDLDRPR